MVSHARYLVRLAVVAALAACGGGSDPTPDAAPDAPAPITGLGQSCMLSLAVPDCPAQMGCLPYAGSSTVGICTPLCLDGATMTADAQGNLMVTPDPLGAGPTATCAAAYTAGIGEAACTSVVFWSPDDPTLMPGTTYTDVGVVCEIFCSAASECPGALRCVQGRCET